MSEALLIKRIEAMEATIERLLKGARDHEKEIARYRRAFEVSQQQKNAILRDVQKLRKGPVS